MTQVTATCYCAHGLLYAHLLVSTLNNLMNFFFLDMTGYVTNESYLGEFDLLVFCAEMFYLLCFAALAVKFFEYFMHFKLHEMLKSDDKYIYNIAFGCFIAAIFLIMSSILARGLHETWFYQVLSVLTYTILSAVALLLRKAIAYMNVVQITASKAYCRRPAVLYEAGSILSSAIILSATISYFYELSAIKIFFIYIITEFLIEIALKIYVFIVPYLASQKLMRDFSANEVLRATKIAIIRIHLSLLIFAACAVTNPNSEVLLEILRNIWLFALLLFLTCFVLYYVINAVLLVPNFGAADFSDEWSPLLLRSIVLLGADIAVIFLLR